MLNFTSNFETLVLIPYTIIFLEEREEPHYCKKLDCNDPKAKIICPVTCVEKYWCKLVDCTKTDAKLACPKTCDEPRWCEMADCKNPRTFQMCRISCKKCRKDLKLRAESSFKRMCMIFLIFVEIINLDKRTWTAPQTTDA